MAKLFVPLLLLAAVVLGVVLTDRPEPRADFAFINRGDVNTLDPQRMSWMQDLRVARLLFEGLCQNDILDPNFGVVPAVAESWDISDDGRTYTFHLRDNAKWNNGEPVTADHFRLSWRRAMLPDLVSDYFAMFMLVEGAQEFYDWRGAELEKFTAKESDYATADDLWDATVAKFDEIVQLKALDDRTLEVTLVRPVPYFLDLCAFAVFYPVYPPLVAQYERPDPTSGALQRRPGWTKPDVLISNGPFVLDRWRFKRDMRFSQNPYWWNKASLDIETIEIPSINDPNASVLAFRAGAVDWVSDVTAPYRGDILADKQAFYREHADELEALRAQGYDQFEIDRRLPADPRKNIHAVPAFGTYFYNFNCLPTLPDGRDNPFHDARVRRAFAMVIDKRAITEEVRRLGEPVARTLIPPGSIGGYTSPKGLPDIGSVATEAERAAIIAEAHRLLAEAGYPNPAIDFPVTVELLFNKDGGHDLIAQTIAKDWERYLGVKTSLAQKEIKVFRVDLKEANYMTARAGWYGDYGDPTTFLELNRTGDGNNDRKYSSERYDALLDEALTELDTEKRMALLSEAERIIMEEDLPMIPLFTYSTVYMHDPARITGLTTHPRTKQNVFLVDVLGDGIGRDEPKPMRMGPYADTPNQTNTQSAARVGEEAGS